MSKFSDEYIELCRKLALPREWRYGDLFGTIELDRPFGPFLLWWTPPDPLNPERGYADKTPFWLPREEDWLDLLEAEGSIGVRVARLNDGYGAYETGADPSARFIGEASDRLIAFCRLWCAVTGREVDG